VPPILPALALLEQALAAAAAELVLPSYRILQTSE
jgi:hypothetical protein